MAVKMHSRRTSALFFIIVCSSAFWNVRATTGVTPTESHSHSVTSINTGDLPSHTPDVTVGETTLPPMLTPSPNSTFNNDNSTAMHSTELSLATTPTPLKSSPEAGSTAIGLATLHSSIAEAQTEHLSSTVIASTTLVSSVAASEEHVSSTVIASTTLVSSVAASEEHVSSTVIASTTLVSSVAASEEHVSSTVIASTTLVSSVATSLEEHVSSKVNKSNSTISDLPTQETSTPQGNSTMIFPVERNTTLVSDKNGNGMKYSETILTSIFSTILVVVLLTILAFCFKMCRKRRCQYSHRPLHENVYESEGYSPPDDTLVISGGLYDAPRIYNPNMTVLEEDDSQPDYVSFSSRPGQFRLEFLPGDKDTDPPHNGFLRGII